MGRSERPHALTPMPRCLVVQHVAPEQPFAVADALVDVGVDVDIRPVFGSAEIPSGASGLDGLVVMGGPMSAASDEGFPTRGPEIELISDALRRGVPTLGICLGAQLLAVAAGGSVTKGATGAEIGWGPIVVAPSCADDRLFTGIPVKFEVLHWHGDTFAQIGRASCRERV